MQKRNYYVLLNESFNMSKEQQHLHTSVGIKKWFWTRVITDLFWIELVLWLVLFSLELIKSGLVSNYLSLPHFAVLLIFHAIWMLAVQPPAVALDPRPFTKKEGVILAIFCVFIGLVITIVTDLSWVLTLCLIFVTLLTILGGSYLMKQDL